MFPIIVKFDSYLGRYVCTLLKMKYGILIQLHNYKSATVAT